MTVPVAPALVTTVASRPLESWTLFKIMERQHKPSPD